MLITFGDAPVPFTVAWSAEGKPFVAPDPHLGHLAICQLTAQGQGKPQFSRPHYERQREIIARGLCDLCAKPLKDRTKVSLSDVKLEIGGDGQQGVFQWEPLLHKECAAESLKHCPHLKRSIEAGRQEVRQVTKYRVQFAAMSREWLEKEVPEYAWNGNQVIGYAKVELQKWIDRELGWLLLHNRGT